MFTSKMENEPTKKICFFSYANNQFGSLNSHFFLQSVRVIMNEGLATIPVQCLDE